MSLLAAELQDDRAAIERSLATVGVPHAPRLAAAARHGLLAGGKRLRPLLSCVVMRALGAAPARHVDVITAVELIHCGSLFHDDLIDGSRLRRGRLAAHVAYDPHAAILAGDLLLALALQRLTGAGLPAIPAAAATAIAEVCAGEVLEREQRFDAEVGVTQARLVNRLKTAALFAYAAEVGAVLAGAPPAACAAARTFGLALGEAFQTIDDLLDWEGDEAVVGKPLGRDLDDGLVTVPVALACERAPAVRATVRAVLAARRREAPSPVPLAAVGRAVADAGGFAAARALAAVDAETAGAALGAFPPGPWRDWLAEVVTRALTRTS